MPHDDPELDLRVRAWASRREGAAIEEKDVQALLRKQASKGQRPSVRTVFVVTGVAAAAMLFVSLVSDPQPAPPLAESLPVEPDRAPIASSKSVQPEVRSSETRTPKDRTPQVRKSSGPRRLRAQLDAPAEITGLLETEQVYVVDEVEFVTAGSFEVVALPEGGYEIRKLVAPLRLIGRQHVVRPGERLRIQGHEARAVAPVKQDTPRRPRVEALRRPSGAELAPPPKEPALLEPVRSEQAPTVEPSIDALELEALAADRRGEHGLAARKLEEALPLAQGQRRGSLAFGLGKSSMRDGRPREASEAFRLAIEVLEPSSVLWAEAHLRWAEAEVARERPEEAIVILEAFLRARPSASVAERASGLLEQLRASRR
ncbi:MAG: hypothetical protein AAGD10_10940 [Myxococcota bacterium]